MHIQPATNAQQWDDFLKAQRFSPFLQSWTMGEVYREIGQEPLRLEVLEEGKLVAICSAQIIPARRGKHLAVQYGPVMDSKLDTGNSLLVLEMLMKALQDVATQHKCSFIRMSPFWSDQSSYQLPVTSYPSPLHLLAEHIWYLPLQNSDPWSQNQQSEIKNQQSLTPDDILMSMRKTTRNLVRRSEKEGVEVVASTNPIEDVELFIKLHDETRQRHKFTPYSNKFFRAQVKHFAPRNECTVYLARHQGEVLAASIHMHFGGETSYHHGASTYQSKIPASYGLQWKAICDALARGDQIYNFWGIAPMEEVRMSNDEVRLEGDSSTPLATRPSQLVNKHHPFAGVTLFKTGFGGQLLNLQHCLDIPLTKSYYFTRAFEFVRKWKRGF